MIDLSTLNYKEKIEITGDFDLTDEKYTSGSIKKVTKVTADGYIFQNEVDEIIIRASVTGSLILIDSVTLEDISYDFAFDIDENIEENDSKDKNLLDINELLWQNIVLEVPIRYTKSDADNLKGDNWEVRNANQKDEEIDPRMAKLLDYYKGGE